MTTSGDTTTSSPPATEPDLTPPERDELAKLAFLQAELEALARRGLLAPEALAAVTVENAGRTRVIEHRGLARAEVAQARRLAPRDPAEARDAAERARALDPSSADAWVLSVQLHRALGEPDRADALAAAAAEHVPGFPPVVADLPGVARREAPAAEAGPEEAVLLEIVPEPPEDLIAPARDALRRGDDDATVALATRVLDRTPDQFDALVMLAFALQRRGDLDEALKIYRRLVLIQPGNDVWKDWVRNVAERRAGRDRQAAATSARPQTEPAPMRLTPVPLVKAAPVEPGLSWSTVAGEFLEDHWQKLILCLAVLLIVVSSNVGAYQLLGPRIWSPLGKSVLAVVYTAMFAGFGTGLVRWGASRAGRIMLLTSLIVIPADFMLAGQMKLLAPPTPYGVVLLVMFGLALFGLIRWVGWALGISRGVWPLSVALFALSATSAASAGGVPWPWSWQFVVFLAPAAVFLLAVSWLNTRFQDLDPDDRLEVTYAALGLFTFAFLTGVVWTGGFVLHLLPTLYAVPVMCAGIAAVRTSKGLRRFDDAKSHTPWLRVGGFTLAALALALALAVPAGSAPASLYSGNTLAASALGLLLFGVLLATERHPAFLYVSFGTLIVAYFGSYYFVHDLMHAVEEQVRASLGYHRPLPLPFKAINGLVFNTLLAGLAIAFRRRWHDDRLARHCHYLGVPFSVACCVFSGFEPKAAVITLSGYTVLYALAVAVFSEPRVVYLAAAALAGAAYFGTTLVAGVGLAEQSLIAALIALGEWGLGALLRLTRTDARYRRPLDHVAAAMGVLATGVAVASALPAGPTTLPAAAALLVVALVAVLANLDRPHPALAYVAAASGSLGYAFFVLLAGDRLGGLTLAQFAVAAGSAACVLALLALRLMPLVRHGAETSTALAVYPRPLAHVGLAQVALTLGLCGLFVGRNLQALGQTDHATLAVALALAAVALVMNVGLYPTAALVHLALACGLGAWVAAARALPGGPFTAFQDFGLAATTYALAVVTAGEAARWWSERSAPGPRIRLLLGGFPEFALGSVTLGVVLAIQGLAADTATTATFATGSLGVLASARARRRGGLVDVAVALAVIAAWSFMEQHVTWPWHGALLLATTAVAAFVARAAGVVAARVPGGALYAGPCERDASFLAWVVLVFGVAGFGLSHAETRLFAAAQLLTALTTLWLTTDRAKPSLTYRSVASFVLAVYLLLASVDSPTPRMYVPGLVAALIALALQTIGFFGRSRPAAAEGRERVYFVPLFRSAAVLTGLSVPLLILLTRLVDQRLPLALSLLVSAASFLLMVKGLGSRNWLYAVVATCCAALYFGFLIDEPRDRLVTYAMVVAYQVWILGLLTRRFEPLAVRRLDLPQTRYDLPLFNSALAAALAATFVRGFDAMDGGTLFSESAGLLLNLAVFALLMTKPYPGPGWVHAGVMLASASAGVAVYPHVQHSYEWLPLGLALANLWQAAAWLVRTAGDRLSRWLGVRGSDFVETFDAWSWVFSVVSMVVVTLVVAVHVCVGLGVSVQTLAGTTPRDWWLVVLALGLGAVFCVSTSWFRRRTEAVMGLAGLVVLTVWWLAATGSPVLAALGLPSASLLPPATALMGLASATVAAGLLRRPAGPADEVLRLSDAEPRARLDRFAVDLGLLLGLLSGLMTFAATRPVALFTLLAAAAACGVVAVARRRILAGYGTGVFLAVAGALGGLELAARLDVVSGGDRVILVALGLLAAVGLLWALAGVLRRADPGLCSDADPTELPARNAAFAMEHVTLLGSLFCAAGVASTVLGPGVESGRSAAAGVGILAALALVAVGLLVRWGATWLVYAAQAAVVGSFLYYRTAFPLPSAVDATVLTLLGYLGFGIAELLERMGLRRFAVPAGRFALAVPLLPLLMAWGDGPLGGSRLFVLFGVATFYGVASFRLQSRPFGYAAAVLFNAFLWFLWWRFNWQLTDRPQFFLVPVGLTAILFAEANREGLKREALNLVRGVGLSTIYLSLAVPVWEHQSLGAWLALLLLSLAGVFAGIGLRVQTFLWLGLAGFVLDVVYQLGRVGLDNTLAKWAIMLALGILLVIFVALNEKKQILRTLKTYYASARQWE